MKRPLHLLRAMIAGVTVATITIVACSLALGYSVAEVLVVSLGAAAVLSVVFVILWFINRRRMAHDPKRSG
ncbi:hypothetical protein [Agromyces aerolatus]|uniref:hypothetical protein n=1 Tax=Agromyces sp. LY-1074 TaxID=3074080 RepID=UPI00285C023A|nr:MULTISPECIES: hypothetical protein [unclassified Agromyces]MDR5701694.1 hypothetical protein [Agromyces sp. LY-1074]MDR5707959.1 hypothetical protein [Agromyces sp. LY-1358]